MPFLSHDGVRIWWNSTGCGAPVLLLNDLGCSSDTWFRLVRQLSVDFEVITVDNRGTGRTGVTPGGPYSIETMAADAVAALDAAGVDSAHVVGFSMGGLIAQEIALTARARTRSLTLVASYAGFDDARTLPPHLADHVARAAHSLVGERLDVLARSSYASSTPIAEIEVDDAVRNRWPTSSQGYANQLLGAATWDRLHDLRDLHVPTLVLVGEGDEVVPVENSRLLADVVPGARLVVLEGAGHQVFTDQEVTAADLVREFVLAARGTRGRARSGQGRAWPRTIASA